VLLTIDIGNTSIKLGVFEGNKIKTHWQLATDINRQADEYGVLLLTLLQNKNIEVSGIDGVVLCSVVPPLVSTFQQAIQKYFGILPMIVEAGVKTGVRICVENPRELGADRVVNAVAAHYLYHEPAIVIDLGTATTFDVISKNGDYLGGVIAPGVSIASEALVRRTAVLPRIEFAEPKEVIGKNTISAMQSGIFFGYIGLIENIVKHIEQELAYKTMVVATGGYAQLIARIPVIEKVEPNLTLIGLQLIYERNKVEGA
jgi:type III pantothenate kinase